MNRSGGRCAIVVAIACMGSSGQAGELEELKRIAAKSQAEYVYCVQEKTGDSEPSAEDLAACHYYKASILEPLVSPFDDSIAISAAISSKTMDDEFDGDFVLGMGCKESVTFAGFMYERRVTSPHVSYRIGRDKMISAEWLKAGDGLALNGSKAIRFLKAIKGRKGDDLVVRMTFNGAVERRFSLDGVDTAIDAVAKACKWS